MKKTFVLSSTIFFVLLLSFLAYSATETPLELDKVLSQSVKRGKTQAYSFLVNQNDGYCVKVVPTQGQPDLYVYDSNFRLVDKSVMPGLEGYSVEKVFVGTPPVGSYHILVIGKGDKTSQYEISLSNAPFISKISASAGLNGSKLKIWGKGFGDEVGTSYVKFGETQATNYISWKNGSIEVEVPQDAPSGLQPVKVVVNNQESNAINFTVGVSSLGSMQIMGFDALLKIEFPDGPLTVPLYERWTKNSVRGTVINGTIYGCYGNQIQAFSADTGDSEWISIPIINDDPDVYEYGYSLTVANNVIYAFLGHVEGTSLSITKLCTFNAKNGELIRIREKEEESYSIYPPVVYEGKLYYSGLVNGKRNFRALDVTTDDEIWHYIPADYNGSSPWAPVVRNISIEDIKTDVAYFAAGPYIYALNADTGEKIWDKQLDSQIGTFGIANDNLFIGTEDNIYCLSLANGDEIWKKAIENAFRYSVYSKGIIYFSGGRRSSIEGYRLIALNAATGDFIWGAFNSSDEPYKDTSVEDLTISNGFCYMVFDCGRDPKQTGFYVLDANTGGVKFRFPERAFPIRINEGKVYAGHTCFGETP